jgi:hypothetical protein
MPAPLAANFKKNYLPSTFLQPRLPIQHAVVISSKVEIPQFGLDAFMEKNTQFRLLLTDDIEKQLAVLANSSVPICVILSGTEKIPAETPNNTNVFYTTAAQASPAVIESTISAHNKLQAAEAKHGMELRG